MEILRRHLKISDMRASTDAHVVNAALSSTEPVERLFGFEVLSHEAGAIDLTRAKPVLPLLFNHDTNQPIGSAENVRVEDGKLRAALRFAKTDRGLEVAELVRGGHITGVSIGYTIDKAEETGKRDGQPIITATRWTLLEASIAPVQADIHAGIGRSILTLPNSRKTKMDPKHDNLTREQEIVSLGEQYAKFISDKETRAAIMDGRSVEQFKETIISKMESRHTDTRQAYIGMAPKEIESYSLSRAVVAMLTSDWSKAGLERSASEAVSKMLGRNPEGFYVPFDCFNSQRRDFNVGTATEAGNLVPTDLRNDLYVDVLRKNLVMAGLGVRILTGLTGNVDIPKKTSSSTIARVTEIQALTESAPATDKISLTPKRFGGFVEYSKQALIQSGIVLDAMLRDDLLASGAADLQDSMVNGSGTSPNIRGIRNTSGIGTVVGGTNGLAPAWSHVVDLESACANSDAEPISRAGYLTNTKVRGKLKQTQFATNLPFIWQNGETPLNGYRSAITNTVPSNLTKGTSTTVCSSIIFGSDWSIAVLALFGAPDITVDPYSLATTGQVRITLNQFADFAVRNATYFSKMDDVLAG